MYRRYVNIIFSLRDDWTDQTGLTPGLELVHCGWPSGLSRLISSADVSRSKLLWNSTKRFRCPFLYSIFSHVCSCFSLTSENSDSPHIREAEFQNFKQNIGAKCFLVPVNEPVTVLHWQRTFKSRDLITDICIKVTSLSFTENLSVIN